MHGGLSPFVKTLDQVRRPFSAQTFSTSLKVAGNEIKMCLTYFGRFQSYKIILGMAILCVMYIIFCLSMLVGIYSSKTQEMREFLHGYGQDTRELIS